MLVRTMSEYLSEKDKFFKNHTLITKFTSNYEDDGYSQTFACEDGATWFEYVEWVNERALCNVCGLEIEIPVKLRKCEYWSTDDSLSKYTYEHF